MRLEKHIDNFTYFYSLKLNERRQKSCNIYNINAVNNIDIVETLIISQQVNTPTLTRESMVGVKNRA